MMRSPSFKPDVIIVCVMSLAPMVTGVMALLSVPSSCFTAQNTTVVSVLFLSTSGLFLTPAGRSSMLRPIRLRRDLDDVAMELRFDIDIGREAGGDALAAGIDDNPCAIPASLRRAAE